MQPTFNKRGEKYLGIGKYQNMGGEDRLDVGSSTATPIDPSNIGFQMLKKHGWKEGTGLGASEQGRLEPVQTYLKKNKRGLGADEVKKTLQRSENPASDSKADKLPGKNKAKSISKRMKKMQEFENQLQEKEFERAFFREFWPDNV